MLSAGAEVITTCSDALRAHWQADALQAELAAVLPGLQLEIVASAGSTNSVLLQRIRQGQTAPVLLVAEEQTQGRGRQGKAWQSARGASLTFSLCLPLRRQDWSGLSLAVGLALAEALDPAPSPAATVGAATAGLRLGLKWPNDLMLLDERGGGELATKVTRKLGGILIESVVAPATGTAPGAQRMAVIGIGLNIAPQVPAVAQAAVPAVGPAVAPGPAAQPSTPALPMAYAALQELHPTRSDSQTLALVAAPLLAMLAAFDAHGFAPLRPRYARRDILAGRPITTTLADWPEGIADGVADDGALWLCHGGQRQRVASGEVSVRVAPTTAAVQGLALC